MKKVLKGIGIFLLILVLLIAAFFAFLTVTQLDPKSEGATVNLMLDREESDRSFSEGDEISVMSWNIGYSALGKESDFFMDGGEQTRPDSKEVVEKNLQGIIAQIQSADADFSILQEIDSGSRRSYGVKETAAIADVTGQMNFYALNYKCPFVPFPWPPLGKVSSGLFTLSTAQEVSAAERVALPSPFSWPVSTANLKRCLLVTSFPLEGTDKQLVLVNLHLEAYDDGEGKAAQTKVLTEFLREQYEAGNYVIAGGDFNQTFPGGLDVYPVINNELWTPGLLDDSNLPGEGWQFAYDTNTPTCRLLNMPYDPANPATQYYVIDGFILSPNVKLNSVETVDAGFEFSDHNPVMLHVTLLPN